MVELPVAFAHPDGERIVANARAGADFDPDFDLRFNDPVFNKYPTSEMAPSSSYRIEPAPRLQNRFCHRTTWTEVLESPTPTSCGEVVS